MFSLLSLLDDIATTLDDVAVMSKVAIKKTSALMSDDLAVNAGVVKGVSPARELPMVKAIFLGSLLNKVYGVTGVLALSFLYPPLIVWIMLVGGIYLSYEGAHKVIHKLLHTKSKNQQALKKFSEAEKVNGAIRTDLILSIEIIVIAQSTLSGSMLPQIITLAAVGLAASLLIYGLVAVIVKIDDFGLYLINKGLRRTGLVFVKSMPYIMRLLGIVGTLAMLLVGGGIIVHTFHLPLYINEHIQNLIVGAIIGAMAVFVLKLFNKMRSSVQSEATK